MFGKDFREILTAEFISVTGGVLAGTALAFATGEIALIPGLLIVLPGFLEMRGNVSGSLSSRLSSGLFLGVVKPRMEHNRIVRGNVVASFLLAIAACLILGCLAYAVNLLVFGVANPAIFFIVLLAGLIANIIEIPATIFFTFWLFRGGHDPNNVMGPFVTTLGDIVSVCSLLIAMVAI